jgi:hypothetical protein
MAYYYKGECMAIRNMFQNMFSKEKYLIEEKKILPYFKQVTNITTSQSDKYRDEIIKYQNKAQKILSNQ